MSLIQDLIPRQSQPLPVIGSTNSQSGSRYSWTRILGHATFGNGRAVTSMHGPFGAFTSVLLPYILGQGCGYEHDYSARNEARRAKWVEKHKGKAQVVEGGDPIRLTGLHVPLGVFNEHRKSSTGPEPKDFSCTGLHTPFAQPHLPRPRMPHSPTVRAGIA